MVPDEEQYAAAVAVLRRGGLVAFPTETVYGLGADAARPDAVARIFAAKGRPSHHPVIVHLASADQLDAWAATVPAAARRLADALWPGPLTLLLRRSDRVPDEVTGGRPSVGLRVPDHPVANRLLRDFGGGVAAPSANRFGRVSPTTAADVVAELGDRVDLVLDGGPCRVGVESTIVDLSSDRPEVLRPGGVTLERLSELLGEAPAVWSGDGEARASGMLAAHYAPSARVELVDASEVGTRAEALVSAGRSVAVLGLATDLDAVQPPFDASVPRLASASVDDYARRLYADLRAADRAGADVALAVPPPPDGVGAAVRDRLRRAAASSSSSSDAASGSSTGSSTGSSPAS